MSPRSVSAAKGFTLLEVIVALTITGFILGSLFSLVAGSKQLSWRSQESLIRAIDARAQLNFALLEDSYSEVEPIVENDRYQSIAGDILEPPERKTQATVFALQEYDIIDDQRVTVMTGTRWLRLSLPE